MSDDTYSPQERRPAPPSKHGVNVGQLMFAIFWIAIFLVILIYYWQLVLFFLFTFTPVAVIAGLIVAFGKRRRAQQLALLKVLSLSAERRLPLAGGVAAFADLCSTGYRMKAAAFGELLEAGVPFPQALASVPGLFPASAVVLSCVGWNEGRINSGLKEAVDQTRTENLFRTGLAPRMAYFGAMILGLQSIGGFMMYFIIPKFEAIFMDFGVDLPTVTILVIQGSHWIMRSGLILLLLPLELALLVYVPFSYFGWVRWELPGVDRLMRRRDAGMVLRSLSVAVEAGRPVNEVITLLGQFYPKSWVRRRLWWASDAINDGMAWAEALRRSGVIRRSDAAVLESAERAGNLAWALRVMADGNERRLGYRLQTVSQLLFPIIVIFVGMLVGVLCAGFFMPLVQLIGRLAG